MIPQKFFVTSGKAVSGTSELNAFDSALKEAGIAQCNLVPVSSVLPQKCEEVKFKSIPVGAITYAVIAKMNTKGKATIGAGITWGWEKEKKYGIVAEAHGYWDRKSLKNNLHWKIREMAKIRAINIEKINSRIETLEVPINNYGSVIVALIYIL